STQKAFIANPLPEGGSQRLYRTGDRASLRADGYLEFHGRFDHQVKLRGYRIELGEIEQVLRSRPGVANAVAVLRKVRGEDALVAYVEPNAAESPTPPDLATAAAAALPAYMIPQHWVFVARIPLTVNGKTDHGALPAPSSTHGASTASPPLTAS